MVAGFGVKRYTKKPVTVEAVHYDGTVTTGAAIVAWVTAGGGSADWYSKVGLFIDTLEGRMETSPGDFVICGTAGEFYPCKGSIFATIYEPAQ